MNADVENLSVALLLFQARSSLLKRAKRNISSKLASNPANPQLNWTYLNSFDGISYIYDRTDWQIPARDWADGVSISWRCSLAAASSIEKPP